MKNQEERDELKHALIIFLKEVMQHLPIVQIKAFQKEINNVILDQVKTTEGLIDQLIKPSDLM